MSKSTRDEVEADAAAKAKYRRGLLRGHKIDIPEVRYKSDLELHDRFLVFSDTLLRLALAGFAAIGFFIATLTDKGDLKAPLKTLNFIVPSSLAVVLLALSAALALGHRFLASDGMFHHLRAIKHLIATEGDASLVSEREKPPFKDNAAADEIWRDEKFILSERLLYASAGALILGIVAIGLGFIVILA